MYRLVVFAFTCCLMPMIHGQSVLRGKVVDSLTAAPLPYVTLVLADGDGAFLAGTTTRENGHYELEGHAAGQVLLVSALGYEDRRIGIGNAIRAVKMVARQELLETVEVRAERTTTRQLIDRRVIEIGQDLQSAGGDAATILDQLPDVQLGSNGQLQLRGSGNVTVLVDGKPNPATGADLLRQLPAATIQRIEIITSPNAKQRAEGLTGIINIVTKGITRRGLTLGVRTAINNQGGYRVGTDAALGGKRLSVFGGIDRGYENSPNQNQLRREGLQPFSRVTETAYIGPALTGRLGADWFPNDRNEWSLGVNYSDNRHDHPYESRITRNGQTQNWQSLTSHVHLDTKVRASYRHNFAQRKVGHYLEADAQFVRRENDLYNLNYLENSEDEQQRTINTHDVTDVTLDYALPVSGGKLEAGLLYKYQNTRADYRAGPLSVTTVRSRYDLDKATAAAYVQGRRTFGPIELQAGLRFESYRLDVQFPGADFSDARQRFDNFFPSFNLLWQPREDLHAFSFGLSRNTSRPGSWQYDPFRLLPYPTDRSAGNVDLQPQFSTNLELAYLLTTERWTARLASYVRFRENTIERIRLLEEDAVVGRWINLGNPRATGMEVAVDFTPSKKYRLSLNLSGGVERLREIPAALPYANRGSQFGNFGIRQNLTILKKLKADLNYQYEFPSKDYLSDGRSSQRVNLALRYQIADPKITIGLRGRNILLTNRELGRDFGDGFIIRHQWRPLVPEYTLSVEYSFHRGADVRRRGS